MLETIIIPLLATSGGILAVNILGSLLKAYIYPKWGAKGVHIAVFLLSALSATAVQYYVLHGVLPDFTTLAGWEHFMRLAVGIYTASVTVYEAILKRVGFA